MLLQKKTYRFFIGMFFSFFMPLQIICAADDNFAQLTKAAAQVQEWKTRTENKARALKNRRNLSQNVLREVESKYLETKVAVDGWLGGLRMELAINKPKNSSDHKELLDNAAEKIREFNAYADSILNRGAREVATQVIIAVLSYLATTVLGEFITDQGEDEAQRERILRVLDNLSFSDFKAL